jgi:hypothetical protein
MSDNAILDSKNLNTDMYINAARTGRLDVIQQLYEHGVLIDKHICYSAAIGGHLDIIKWGYTHGAYITNEVFTEAIDNGHLHIIQWAVASGIEIDIINVVLFAAILCKQTHILEWLLSTNLLDPITEWPNATYIAAMHGHLQMLQWLREREVPWHPKTCINIIERSGNYEILKWALENGAPRVDLCRASMISQYASEYYCIGENQRKQMKIALLVHNSGCPCSTFNHDIDVRRMLHEDDPHHHMYAHKALSTNSVPHDYIQKHTCCDLWTVATTEAPSAHRWRKLRIYARIIGRLMVIWNDIIECRYAPGGVGFVDAKLDFEAISEKL